MFNLQVDLGLESSAGYESFKDMDDIKLAQEALSVGEAQIQLRQATIELHALDVVKTGLEDSLQADESVKPLVAKNSLILVGAENIVPEENVEPVVENVLVKVWNKIKEAIIKVWEWIKKTFKRVVDFVKAKFGKKSSGSGSSSASKVEEAAKKEGVDPKKAEAEATIEILFGKDGYKYKALTDEEKKKLESKINSIIDKAAATVIASKDKNITPEALVENVENYSKIEDEVTRINEEHQAKIDEALNEENNDSESTVQDEILSKNIKTKSIIDSVVEGTTIVSNAYGISSALTKLPNIKLLKVKTKPGKFIYISQITSEGNVVYFEINTELYNKLENEKQNVISIGSVLLTNTCSLTNGIVYLDAIVKLEGFYDSSRVSKMETSVKKGKEKIINKAEKEKAKLEKEAANAKKEVEAITSKANTGLSPKEKVDNEFKLGLSKLKAKMNNDRFKAKISELLDLSTNKEEAITVLRNAITQKTLNGSKLSNAKIRIIEGVIKAHANSKKK